MKSHPVGYTQPGNTILYSWIRLTLLAVIAVASACKPLTRQKNSLKSERSHQSGEVYLAFNQPVHRDVSTFLNVVRGSKNGETIKLSVLQLIPRIMSEDSEGIVVSDEIDMQGVTGDGPGVDRFVPVQFGDRVFIFRMISPDRYGAFDSMPDTYLASRPIRERVRSYLSTKYTETDRIARLHATLDTIEFLARVFPGVDGADRAINSTGSERLMGVVSAVGDVASFGVGSKIKLVSKGAQAVVVTAATVRLSVAAAKAANGTATYATGIDAALAATEVGLSAVTFVKLKISKGGRAVIESAEGAELVGKQVGKSADDVLAKGLDSNDLSKLGIDASKYADEASSAVSSLQVAAKKIPHRSESIVDNTIQQLLTQPYQGKILDTEIAAIQKKIAGGDFPTPLEVQKLLTVATPNKPTAFVNVTENTTIQQVFDSDGLYWGYIGFPGLPKGVYATAKPISWCIKDLKATAGKSGVERDALLVFIGDAAQQFGLVSSDGIVGTGISLNKTIMKTNREYASRGGDLLFKEYKLYTDGTRNMLVVSKVEKPGTLHNLPPDAPGYQDLIKVDPAKFREAVFMDMQVGTALTLASFAAFYTGETAGSTLGGYFLSTK